MVRECGDLSAGVFDLKGRMLAQAVTGTPGHVNSMAESVNHFIAAFPLESMADGDIYLTNDPWKGTGHLNDFVVTTPCFHRGRLVAIFSCTSHIIDIGGIGYGPGREGRSCRGNLPPVREARRAGTNEPDPARCGAREHPPADGDRGRRVLAGRLQRHRLRAAAGDAGRVRAGTTSPSSRTTSSSVPAQR